MITETGPGGVPAGTLAGGRRSGVCGKEAPLPASGTVPSAPPERLFPRGRLSVLQAANRPLVTHVGMLRGRAVQSPGPAVRLAGAEFWRRGWAGELLASGTNSQRCPHPR